jgi:hypothetical protein
MTFWEGTLLLSRLICVNNDPAGIRHLIVSLMQALAPIRM